MVSSIQLNENVKRNLENLKEKRNDSYEDVIVRLIKEREIRKRKHTELMIEGAKEIAEESMKITKEFEAIEDLRDWEW